MNFGFNHGFASSSFDPTAYRIKSITETVEGSCEYSAGSTCVATSTIVATTVNPAGAETFTWSIIKGTITSGQGTKTVTVESDADIDVSIYLTCEASDTVDTISRSLSFVQEHTIIPLPIITLSPVDKTVGSSDEPILFESDGSGYDTIKWTYWNGSVWADLGAGANGNKDYFLESTSGIGNRVRVEYTSGGGTVVSDEAIITADSSPREFYTLGGDVILDRIDIYTMYAEAGDTCTFKFIANTVTSTRTVRLLGDASGSSHLHHTDAYTVVRGTLKLDGVDAPTGTLVPTDGLEHTLEYTPTQDVNFRYIGGNPTHGGTADYIIYDIKFATATNGYRFYPIDDGWASHPTLRETLSGSDGHLISGVETSWSF